MEKSCQSLTRKQLAQAYGFNDRRPIYSRIEAKLNMLSDEQLVTLGKWKGKDLLLPEQVEIIVYLLGKPAQPNIVYGVNAAA